MIKRRLCLQGTTAFLQPFGAYASETVEYSIMLYDDNISVWSIFVEKIEFALTGLDVIDN